MAPPHARQERARREAIEQEARERREAAELLEAMPASGFFHVAIDLPGYGSSPGNPKAVWPCQR